VAKQKLALDGLVRTFPGPLPVLDEVSFDAAPGDDGRLQDQADRCAEPVAQHDGSLRLAADRIAVSRPNPPHV
jgi:hypothetical protein